MSGADGQGGPAPMPAHPVAGGAAGPALVRVCLDELDASYVAATRAALDPEAVDAYRERLDRLPPIKVTRYGSRLILLAGQHRVAAARQAGRTELPAEIVELEPTDGATPDRLALLGLAVRDNARHGVRLTNADKALIAAEAARLAPPTLSNRELAALLGHAVSHAALGKARRRPGNVSSPGGKGGTASAPAGGRVRRDLRARPVALAGRGVPQLPVHLVVGRDEQADAAAACVAWAVADPARWEAVRARLTPAEEARLVELALAPETASAAAAIVAGRGAAWARELVAALAGLVGRSAAA